MRVQAVSIARAARAPLAWPAMLFSGAVALWASAMAPRLEAEARFGLICSAHGLGLHCPACYAAAALAAAGLVFAGLGLRRGGV